MRTEVSDVERRTGGSLFVLVGLVHLFAPNLTVDLFRAVSAETLDAAFIPRDGTNARVRLLGLVLVAVGLVVHRGTAPTPRAGDRRSS